MNTEEESEVEAKHISADSNTDSEVYADIPSSNSDSDDLPLLRLAIRNRPECHAGINSMIIHMFNNSIEKNKTNLEENSFEKGLSLVRPHLGTRRQNQRLPRELRQIIGKYFQKPLENFQEPPAKRSNTMQRCSHCPRQKVRKTRHICKNVQRSNVIHNMYRTCKFLLP
ncbi:hypothetical protein ACJJTC_001872 [Scirpophaga incertulas]